MKKTMLIMTIVILLGFGNVALGGDDSEIALKVTGNIGNINSKDKKSHEFTLKDINRLESIEIRATTPFTGSAAFVGPRLIDILEVSGAKKDAKEVVAKGLDGYQVTIPISDFVAYEVIAAHTQNGKSLTLETKGPLWLMYPIDKYPKDLVGATIDNRLVWSLIELRVK